MCVNAYFRNMIVIFTTDYIKFHNLDLHVGMFDDNVGEFLLAYLKLVCTEAFSSLLC